MSHSTLCCFAVIVVSHTAILPPRCTLVLCRNRNGSPIELVDGIRHTRYRRCDWLERTFRQHITPFTVLRRHGRERESGLLCDGRLQTRCISEAMLIFPLLYICTNSFGELASLTAVPLQPHSTLTKHSTLIGAHPQKTCKSHITSASSSSCASPDLPRFCYATMCQHSHWA